MPLYSVFTPFGHLRFKRGPSRFRTIYDSMRDGQGDAYGPNDVHQEARIYASARCIAVSDGELERARNERRPGKSQQLLADHERDYGLAPTASQSVAQRRDALALQVKIIRGSRKESLDEALSTLLGSDFIEAKPMKDLVSPPTQWPASPGAVGNWKRGALYRVHTLQNSSALVGTYDRIFADVVANQDPIKAGDVIVMEPGNPSMAEAVTVQAITGKSDLPGVVGFSVYTCTLTATKPHPAGIVCTTSPFPLLTSTQRHILIRVSVSCAVDAVKRAAINQLMRRMLRGVTTWEIQTVVAGAQLTLDDDPKGKLSAYVLG